MVPLCGMPWARDGMVKEKRMACHRAGLAQTFRFRSVLANRRANARESRTHPYDSEARNCALRGRGNTCDTRRKGECRRNPRQRKGDKTRSTPRASFAFAVASKLRSASGILRVAGPAKTQRVCPKRA
jgi:hypothetical protein